MHIAVQTCVITALRDVPTKLFTFRFCLIHLKNSSTCQRGLVNVRNGLRRQMEVRRQKHVVLPRLPIVVPDAPQPMRALLSPLRARELDGLIRSHAPLRVDFPRLHHAVLDPPLESRHQVNPLRNQRIDPRKVHVRAVRGDDAALRQCQRARRLDVRRLPVRHPNERRQIPLVVQADVHFHRPLRPPELRPRKRRQTQVNGCRIHREQLGFEPVAMSRRLRLAAPQQSPVQLLVHLPRLLGVHPRERRPRHHADPQVVELARLCGKIRDDVPQAAASCQLGHPHRHELAPAGHAPRHPTRLVLACEALELMVSVRA